MRRRGSLPGYDAGVGMPPAAIIRAAAHAKPAQSRIHPQPQLASHGHRAVKYQGRWWNSDLGFRLSPSPAGKDKMSRIINSHCNSLRQAINSEKRARRRADGELTRLREQLAKQQQQQQQHQQHQQQQ